MSVIDNLRVLVERARGYPRDLAERLAETYLVQPFIESIGYDRLDHGQVQMQYPVQIASRTFLCDYAIKRDGEPIILIECKKTESGGNRGTRRARDARGQLSSYFVMSPSVWLGIYTTGFEYRFYSGYLENGARRMDDEPFLTLDLLNFDEGVAGQVAAYFAKDRFDPNTVQGLAQNIRDRRKIENALREELRTPSDGLVRLVMEKVGADRGEVNRYKPIVQEVAPQLLSNAQPQHPAVPATPASASPSSVAAMGATPTGIPIRWVNRGQTYEAILLEHGHGSVWVDGKQFPLPSKACRHLLPDRSANGWSEWEYFDRQDQSSQPISQLRGLSDEEQVRRAGASIGDVAPPQRRQRRS